MQPALSSDSNTKSFFGFFQKAPNWVRIFPFIMLHIACLGVFFVDFSWSAVYLCIGMYFLRMFGITAGYHRYFSHRAYKTSRWFQFVMAWIGCSAGQSQTLDLSADTGMRVTVTCTGRSYNEGETSPGVPKVLRVYRVQAVACNGTGTCPDNAAATGAQYVERAREVSVTD